MLFIFSSPFLTMGLLVLLAIWIVVLTYIVVRERIFLSKILTGSEKDTISGIINNFRKDLKDTQKELTEVTKRQDAEEAKANGYLQKIGLIRFNPFADTGGHQSFAVSVLDRNNNGIIFSQLFQRQGSRWFVKKITNGKSDDVELSEEEKKTIIFDEKNIHKNQ